MSFDVVGFNLAEGIVHFLKVFGGVLAVALFVSFLVSILKNGGSGAGLFFSGLGRGFSDFLHTSPKRVWAVTVLTWREASRNKALFVFVIFVVLIMFGGWFLRGSSDNADVQVKGYISFILTAMTWLAIPIMLLLSCWGLPADIKNRSLHTVVTKPVRRQEVMLGRFFGFTLVGTVVLSIMGVTGYFWIVGQVPEGARNELAARVPVYCDELSYLAPNGTTAERGVNVGDLWKFRSYIAGGTKALAAYQFKNLDLETIRREGQLRLEYNFEASRTHKGDIGSRLLCQLTVVNDESGLRVPLPPFGVQEFSRKAAEKTIILNEKVSFFEEGTSSNTKKEVSLVDDVLKGNSVTVEVKCLDPGQFIGVSRPDLFVKMPDRSFASNYFKGVLGIWLQMVLIIVLGVTASCFVKGPVATLLTFGVMLVGVTDFASLMRDLTSGDRAGGGPFEAAYRMWMHMNPSTELDIGPAGMVLQGIDFLMLGFLWTVQHLIPRFDFFNMNQYVANGIDVPWSASMLPSILVTLAFVIPCIILGYFSLQLREMEAK